MRSGLGQYLSCLLLCACQAPSGPAPRPTPPPVAGGVGMFVVGGARQWRLEQGGAAAVRGLPGAAATTSLGPDWVRLGVMPLTVHDDGWHFPFDPWLDHLRGAGIRILGTVSFSLDPPGGRRRQRIEGELGPRQLARWLDQLRAIARHHRGRIWCWQIGNEVDYPDQDIGPAHYAQVWRAATAVLEEEDPGALVCPGGMTSVMEERFVQRFLGEYLPPLMESPHPPDLLDLHFHHDRGHSADFAATLDWVLDALQSTGLPLIVTECTTYSGAVDDERGHHKQTEDDQAREQLRRCLHALARGVPIALGTDMDKPRWREHADHPFSRNGLLHNPRRTYGGETRDWPKKAWYSARLLSSIVQRQTPRKLLDDPWSPPIPGVHGILLGGSLIVWREPDVATTEVHIELGPGRWALRSMIPRRPSAELHPGSWMEAFEIEAMLEGSADLTLGADPLVLMPAE